MKGIAKSPLICFIQLILFVCLSEKSIANSDTLRVGVVAYKNSKAIEAAYLPLMGYVAKKINVELKLIIAEYDELVELMLNYQVDVGVFSPFAYLQARKEQEVIESVYATHKAYGKMEYTAVIITKKDKGIEELADLKNKRFSFVKPGSTSGYELPLKILRSRGIELDDFTYIDYPGDHMKTIQALLNDKTDAIATYKEAYENDPNINAEQFQILFEQPVPYNAYVFSSHVEDCLKDKIKKIMFKAHTLRHSNKGLFWNSDWKKKKRKGDRLGIQGWFECNDGFYNALRTYLNIERIKPELEFSISVSESLQNDPIVPIVEQEILEILKQSRRITIVNNAVNQANIDLQLIDDTYYFSFFFNNEMIKKGKLDRASLERHLPIIIAAETLNSEAFNIKTTLKQDPKNYFITYGKADGINLEEYEFWINDRKLTVKEISDNSTIFINQENMIKDEEVRGVYVPKSIAAVELTSSNNSDKVNWLNLDLIGVIIAICSIVVSVIFWYFNRIREKRFKYMRYEANKLLKEYLKGKRIETQLTSLKIEIGDLLEKRNIKTIQYNLLKSKINEISQIVNGGHALSEEIQEVIQEIIADGVVTEKEYVRLISLIKEHRA